MRKLISCILILVFITSLANQAKARDNDAAGAAFIGYILISLFDIFSAPHSAQKYNDKIILNIPAPPKQNEKTVNFGQPRFTREQLVKKQDSFYSHQIKLEQLPNKKSPRLAFFLSLGATVLPVVLASELDNSDDVNPYLVSFGLFVGPSVGHFYANQWGRGIGTTLLRVACAAVFFSNFEWYIDD